MPATVQLPARLFYLAHLFFLYSLDYSFFFSFVPFLFPFVPFVVILSFTSLPPTTST